jgi:hypothetical protein
VEAAEARPGVRVRLSPVGSGVAFQDARKVRAESLTALMEEFLADLEAGESEVSRKGGLKRE